MDSCECKNLARCEREQKELQKFRKRRKLGVGEETNMTELAGKLKTGQSQQGS